MNLNRFKKLKSIFVTFSFCFDVFSLNLTLYDLLILFNASRFHFIDFSVNFGLFLTQLNQIYL